MKRLPKPRLTSVRTLHGLNQGLSYVGGAALGYGLGSLLIRGLGGQESPGVGLVIGSLATLGVALVLDGRANQALHRTVELYNQ